MKMFQTEIRFLGHEIDWVNIRPIQWSIKFVDKLLNEIKDYGTINWGNDEVQVLYNPIKNSP